MPLVNIRQILFRNLNMENGEFFQAVEKNIRVYSNKIMNVFYELYKDGNASYEVPLCTITDPDLYGIVKFSLEDFSHSFSEDKVLDFIAEIFRKVLKEDNFLFNIDKLRIISHILVRKNENDFTFLLKFDVFKK